MITARLRAFLYIATALVVSVATRAATPAPADPAPGLVATINSVIDMAIGKSPAAISSALPAMRSKMEETFAIDAIVRRAFGSNWAKLNAAQQAQATDLLGRLIIRTYATDLSTGSRPTIAVTSSKLIAPERWEVASTASQDGKTVNVVYRLAPINGKWMVYDVLAENVSVVGNYRQQFDAHFQRGTADQLLDLLRSKLAEPVPVEKAKS